jgi:DNA-binding NtrC family response regulator
VKRILVVDDDPLMGEIVAKALGDYEVLIVYSGDEALAVAAADQSIDLVITDYLMPSMMGDELLGRLREWYPSLKSLVMTGHGDVLRREDADWWLAQPSLAKPFTISALRDSVSQLIGSPSHQ